MAKRKAISKKLRFEVFKRDSFTCQYCGKSAPDVVLHVDHVLRGCINESASWRDFQDQLLEATGVYYGA